MTPVSDIDKARQKRAEETGDAGPEPAEGEKKARDGSAMNGKAKIDPTAGSIAEAAAEEEAQVELLIASDGQITMAVGGKRPNRSEAVLRGGVQPLEGQFEKGETVRLEITATVAEVHFVDVKDAKHGTTVETKRKHVLKIDSVSRLDLDEEE